jgi:hypothetical protein
VQLDPGAPLSFATPACAGATPEGRSVTVADPFGPDEAFALTRVHGLELGGAAVPDFAAGLIAGKGCLLVLGGDALAGLALEVRAGARTVTFRPSAGAAAWLATVPAGHEVQALALTREPRHDWPLLAVRVSQGRAHFTGPLLFSAREPRSRLYETPAREAGLRPGLELLRGLPLPDGLALPAKLKALRGFAVDQVELTPGFGVSSLLLGLEAGAAPHAPLGVLGADVWGRFDAIIDLPAKVVVLHRPRVLISGAGAQCDRGGAPSQEACFELHSRRVETGLEVALVVWRALPEGAHVTLDLTGVEQRRCKVGLTFPPTDRGRSSSHLLPWSRLREALPSCGEALSRATGVAPGLLEDGPMPGCPGVCAFAQDLESGRLTCECQATHPSLDEEAEQTLLELYRRLLEERTPTREPEPADP